MKDFFVQINRAQVSRKIAEIFDQSVADEYIRQIEAHEIYVHDETSLKPYCVSVTLYPFLLDGLSKLGGESKAPQHLASFCGSFINLVFAISAQFAGAVATVEFLTYFDYFARKDYGDDYLETHGKEIANHMQQVVYSINQPAAARGYQSVFGIFLFTINTISMRCSAISSFPISANRSGRAWRSCKTSSSNGSIRNAPKPF